MRVIAAVMVLCVFVPRVAAAQTSTGEPPPPAGDSERRHHGSLQVAGGPILTSVGGYVLSAAFGYSLPRLELLVNVERNHVPFQSSGSSSTRGGTLTFVSGELRFAWRPPNRVSPFAIAGAGLGVSRPNVNDVFTDPVTNDLRVMYLGGGVRIPLRRGFSLSGDARCMLALEGDDGLLAVWPVRASLAWRF